MGVLMSDSLAIFPTHPVFSKLGTFKLCWHGRLVRCSQAKKRKSENENDLRTDWDFCTTCAIVVILPPQFLTPSSPARSPRSRNKAGPRVKTSRLGFVEDPRPAAEDSSTAMIERQSYPKTAKMGKRSNAVDPSRRGSWSFRDGPTPGVVAQGP